MNPIKGLSASDSLLDRLNQAGDLFALSTRIAECIGDLVPIEAAVFVPGTPGRIFSPGAFPADRLNDIQAYLENFPNLLQELAQSPDRNAKPRWLEDGAVVFLLPLVHAGALEGVLCLHRKNADCQDVLMRQIASLDPVCRIAAGAIARTLEKEAETRLLRAASSGRSSTADERVALAHLASGVIGKIAHDIRTPAAAVRGYAKMMLDGRTGALTEGQRDGLQAVFDGANQLAALANLAVTAAGQIESLHAEKLDVRQIWMSACNAKRDRALERAVTIKERISEQDMLIFGSRSALSALLEDLLAFVFETVEPRTEVTVELTPGRMDQINLKISLPHPAAPLAAASEAILSRLRDTVFLHGGTISLAVSSRKDPEFTIALPGCEV